MYSSEKQQLQGTGSLTRGTVCDWAHALGTNPRSNFRRLVYSSGSIDVKTLFDIHESKEPFVGKDVLPPFQIISHFKNLGESKFFKFYSLRSKL